MPDLSCEQVRAALDAGRRDDAVVAHLDGCADCSRYDLGELEELPFDADALHASVVDAIAAEQGPIAQLRAWSTGRRQLAALGLALGIGFGFGLLRPRADWDVYPMVRLWTLAGVEAVAVVTLLRGALPDPAGRVRPRLGRITVLATGVFVALSLLPPAHHDHPASLEGTGDDFAFFALRCLAIGSAAALPVLAAVWTLTRTHSRRARMLGALGAAMAGYLALQLHCPVVWVEHRLVGHTLVAAVIAALALRLPGGR
jgi:hypothetical protein